ncbi:MAG: peptidase and in kexin sedolisin [Bacteroidetes bacterium]|jgi:subtilisin family serine protease|nr:peptidase and in kexin sedolisin [Bacteroidota bacterium]
MVLNKMKTKLLLFLILLSSNISLSQTTTNYWIIFKDKNSSPYSLERPEEFLSQRAINRRANQHISLKQRDIPVNPAYVVGVSELGAKIKNRSKWMNGITVTVTDNSIPDKIAALPYVKSITKIVVIPSLKADTKFETETNIIVESQDLRQGVVGYNYGPSLNQASMIGADCMHNWGYSGQGMVIAVLDAGFTNANILPAFDSIRLNNQILGCRDFVTGDTMVYEDHYHGMNVLSTMAGNLPGKIVGTAPKASYWLLRTEDGSSETIQEEINWMVGAEFADSVGADIINSSLGYTKFDDTTTSHTFADMDGNTTIVTKAADWAAETGMFVVSSAGNDGTSPWKKIAAPADADSVLTVGSVDAFENVSSFSSRGPTADGRIKPNTVAQGGPAITAANGGDITANNGTSFSGPITAGAVACLWQANPGRTNMELMLAIHQSSSQYLSPDTVKGYGIPDFCWANFILAGINENILEEEILNVYPNPFSSGFEVNYYSGTKQNAVVELLDISGRSISLNEQSLEMNVKNKFSVQGSEKLANGIYILQIRTADKILTKKLIKE